MLFTILEEGKLSLVYEANLISNKAIDFVKFNPTSSLIATTSTDSKNIYFVNISSKGKCRVVGYFQTPFEILNITWNDSKSSNDSPLLILMNSLVGSIAPPN